MNASTRMLVYVHFHVSSRSSFSETIVCRYVGNNFKIIQQFITAFITFARAEQIADSNLQDYIRPVGWIVTSWFVIR